MSTKKEGFGGWNKVFGMMLSLALVAVPAVAAPDVPGTTATLDAAQARLMKQVRHELVMLPFLSVFDNLAFQIQGTDTVVLTGQVVRPTLRSSAERVVRRVEGIAKVVNNIEVLPLSRFDDSLRLATYRALFSRPGLDRYAMPVISPIRIIVRNGEITLVGVVSRQADKDMAGILANGMSGAFKVTNELMVVKN